MTVTCFDADNDGWPDIYVASDSSSSLLFMNRHDGTFSEEGLIRGVALSEDGLEQAGMGIGIGDFDRDGNLDVFKTHFADDTNIVYRNNGDGTFEDETARMALGVETRFVGWGAGIVDLDNDGYPDLFLVTGSVHPELEAKLPSFPAKTPRVVFRKSGQWPFRGVDRRGWPGSSRAAHEPGLRFRRFRQRRGYRRSDCEYE